MSCSCKCQCNETKQNFYVIAQSVYNDGQYLTLESFRKNKRTQYRFTTDLNKAHAFADARIALNYGKRNTIRMSPEVVNEDSFKSYVDAQSEYELDNDPNIFSFDDDQAFPWSR